MNWCLFLVKRHWCSGTARIYAVPFADFGDYISLLISVQFSVVIFVAFNYQVSVSILYNKNN